MPESIQEVLHAHGYKENPAREQFERNGDIIPYEELRGYTVNSFREKAKRRGWLKDFSGKEQSQFPSYRWP